MNYNNKYQQRFQSGSLDSQPTGGYRINRLSSHGVAPSTQQNQLGTSAQSHYSPVNANTKQRKPPLPAPFMQKVERNGLGFTQTNQQQMFQQEKYIADQILQYQVKHPHQIS